MVRKNLKLLSAVIDLMEAKLLWLMTAAELTDLTPFDRFCFALSEVDAPFARWSKDQVCDWMQEQGLGLYTNMARVWISSGQTLLQASQQDLERVRHGRRI